MKLATKTFTGWTNSTAFQVINYHTDVRFKQAHPLVHKRPIFPDFRKVRVTITAEDVT